MVNYPNGSKKNWNTPVSSYGGRGMELEKEISITNQYYLEDDRAVIHKKPTPVTIVKVDYPMRSAAKITEAYFKLPSTTDYNGIYRGKYIDFEAKECAINTSFPLKSIHAHQIKHLDDVLRHGAIAFVIVRFTKLEITYFVEAKRMIEYIRNTDRSSIPYSWFEENGHRIPFNYLKPVDYLQIVDELYFKE
ncbi:MAG: Holliday junction resolvase RecU [Solobacterium sp.]|nr:Holliday junction resolvase RecU [Solobacterium sp.]